MTETLSFVFPKLALSMPPVGLTGRTEYGLELDVDERRDKYECTDGGVAERVLPCFRAKGVHLASVAEKDEDGDDGDDGDDKPFLERDGDTFDLWDDRDDIPVNNLCI